MKNKKFYVIAPPRYKETLDPENFIKRMNWVSTNYVLWPVLEVKKLGWDAEILLHSNQRKSIKHKNIKFKAFKTIKVRDMLFSYEMLKYVLKNRPDFIYLHNGMWTNWAILKLAKSSKKILMPHYMPHYSFFGKLFFKIEKKFFNYADIVIALTPWEKDIFLNFVDENKIKILPHPIDTTKIRKIENFEKRDEIVITSICGVIRTKGLDLLAKIWNELEKKYKIKWYIAGEILDRKYYEEIKILTNYSRNVVFLGHQNKNEIIKLLSKTDIYVQPSRRECFGLSLIEAQAFGVPIISTRTMAIPYVVSPDNFLIEPENINQLKDYIIQLIEDADLRIKVGKSNKNFIKRFDYRKVSMEFKNILSELDES
jgi:glycosyltransferase involved in cell wall biosynthesis